MTSGSPLARDPLVEVLGELLGLLDVAEFRHGLLRALRQLVPADWIALNDIGSNPESILVLIEPPFPAEAHETYARHAHDNPLLQRYLETGDGRAYRFSDVTTPGRLHATALYREFYGPIGLEHQIAFTLPHEPDRVLAVALSRRNDDFSDAEQDLLNRARPFLIQVFRNAAEHSRIRAELEHRREASQLPPFDRRVRERLAARGLTRQETEVLALASAGSPDRLVAELIGVSERTVQKHLQRCYTKLGVHSRGQAAALAWSIANGPTSIPRP